MQTSSHCLRLRAEALLRRCDHVTQPHGQNTLASRQLSQSVACGASVSCIEDTCRGRATQTGSTSDHSTSGFRQVPYCIPYSKRTCKRCGSGVDNEHHLLLECKHSVLVGIRSGHRALFEGIFFFCNLGYMPDIHRPPGQPAQRANSSKSLKKVPRPHKR